ncbi:MAG: SDR family oxidoreductase, partial [Nitrospira sp.]
MKVLVTGASGFVGSAICARLVVQGMDVIGSVRHLPDRPLSGVDYRIVGDLDANTDWRDALTGVDTIVHCAARVHVMRETAADPLVGFRAVNVAGTEQLARQAAAAWVRRFVFLSSVKVNGEGGSVAYCETDSPAPQDAYGISKYEAELGLREIAAETGMEVVMVRSPLIYGPGVKANFQALMHALVRGIPLPLGAIHNRRSLVSLDNVVDLIITCIEHPAAANETFLVSDGEDLSTTELICRLARAMGRPARLIPMPTTVLMAGATLLGKREVARRLCGTLQVNITRAREVLGWTPPVSVDEGLRRTANHYLQ